MGVTAGAVHNLRYLESFDLACRIDKTTWRGTKTHPDCAMPAPDVIDHATEKKERHTEDRNKYRVWKDAKRTLRDAPRETAATTPTSRPPFLTPITGRFLMSDRDDMPEPMGPKSLNGAA